MLVLRKKPKKMTPEEKPRWKKILSKTLKVLGLLFLILFGGTFIVLRFYEDEVVGFAITKINGRLATEASISSADLTFWETFPHAAIKFNDVFVREMGAEKDTLIFAKTGYLSFNVWDLFSGEYAANQIIVEDGFARFKVNKKGEDNWHILKPSADTSNSTFSIDIEKIDLRALDLSFENAKTKFFVDLNEVNGEIQGAFSSEKFECAVQLKTYISDLFSGNTAWVSERDIQISANFNADNTINRYDILDCEISIDQVPFLVNGYYINSSVPSLDMTFSGNDLTLSKVLGLVPSSYKSTIEEYSADGRVTFDASLKGKITEKESPVFDAKFSMLDGRVKQKSSGVAVDNLQFSGGFHWDKKQHKLSINTCKGNLEGGDVEVQGTVADFTNPQLDLRIMANVGLEDVRDFMSVDTLDICEGKIYTQIGLKGRPKSNQYELTGKAELSGGELRVKNSTRLFDDVGATVVFDNKNATVKRLIGSVNGSDFNVNGTLKNLIPFLLKENERLIVDASLQSKTLNLTELLETEESTKSQKDYLLSLPERIDFSLNSQIGNFYFGKFEANDIRGVINLKGGKLSIDPVSFGTSGGNFLTQISLQPINESAYSLRMAASFKDIDIQRLFRSFDNFGQEFITDRHLRGKTTASVQMSFIISNTLEIDRKTVNGLIDIGIKDGELIGLESLQEIAVYIKKNKFIAPFVDEDKFAEKMKDIKFSYLENVIEIKDQVIVIPSMDIKSSALDISVNGKHGFDNKIDYTIGFRLRDIMLRKDRGEADDGLGKQIYIYMRGTTSDPEFGLDKNAAKADRQEQIAAEKNNIKALLKEEFGLFKNDSDVGTYTPDAPKQQSTTTVTWDENDVVPAENKEEKSKDEKIKLQDEGSVEGENAKTNKKGKKLPKWLQEKD